MLIAVSVIISVLLLGGVWFWWKMGEPLYKVGMARAQSGLRSPLAPPPQPDDANIWRVENDIDLHHFSRGTGPPILFIHGGPGIPVRRVPDGLEQLAQSYEIHFYDHRGCGQSTKPFDRFESKQFYANMLELDKTLGIAAQIADIERIRRILGQDKLTLIGHSFGAFLATLYAAEFPEHVAAMILLAPADLVVFPQQDGNLFDIMRERLPSEMHGEYGDFVKEYLNFSDVFTKSEADLIALAQRFVRYYNTASGQTSPDSRDDDLAIGGWLTTASFLSLGKRHDYSNAVQAIDVPTLVIHGSRDLQPESASRSYADLLQSASMEVISDAGHFVLQDAPSEFATIALKFLKTLTTPS